MRIHINTHSNWVHLEESIELDSVKALWIGPQNDYPLQKILANKQLIIIEGKSLVHIDTSGLQFIVNFILLADQQKIPLQWEEPSDIIRQNARILGLEYLLKLENYIKEVKLASHLEKILPSFVEESSENIKDFEEALTTIQEKNDNQEKINQIFRIMHTLKGNSGLLGLNVLKDLTHKVESFLEIIRTHPKKLQNYHIDYLGELLSTLKEFFSALQKRKAYDERPLKHVNNIFQELTRRLKSTQSEEKNFLGYKISIKPQSDFFKRKGDPIEAFRTLQGLGQIEVTCITHFPEMVKFDPEQCYLSFEIKLYTEASEKDILEILLWVFDETEVFLDFLNFGDQKNLEEAVEKSTSETSTAAISVLRVPVEKIESVLNSVSELVILESMFKQSYEEAQIKSTKLDEIIDNIQKASRALEYNVLHMGIVPVSIIANRFPRTAYDVALKLGKEINFVIRGERNELDKNIIEKITDPLLHLIRNAIDHGIEKPETREALGKDRKGTITFDCYQEGESIIIKITDDGRGLDPELIMKTAIEKKLITEQEELTDQKIFKLLFRPGFSTAEKISDISGRGVGLDVVEKNIRSLGGSIEIESTLGKSTVFKLKVPLTSAIIECQLIEINNQIYIIPISEIIGMIKFEGDKLIRENQNEWYQYQEDKLEHINITKIFDLRKENISTSSQTEAKYVIILKGVEKPISITCDDLLQQQRVIVKKIEDNLCKIPGVAGGTILGNGEIGLILNIREIILLSKNKDPLKNWIQDFFDIIKINTKLAIEKREKFNKDEKIEFINFSLDSEEYVFKLLQVREVYPWKEPNPVPSSPNYLLGLINYRGIIIPIFDLKIYLGYENPTKKLSSAFMIMDFDTDSTISLKKIIGFSLDNMPDVQALYAADFKSLDSIESKVHYPIDKSFIEGVAKIEKREIALLNLNKIILYKSLEGS